MRHRLSPRAAEDVARIYRQSVINFGLAHADRYFWRLEEAFAAIARNPHASPARPELGGVRLKRHDAHHIFYATGEDEVVIVRVLHGRQDPRSNIKP